MFTGIIQDIGVIGRIERGGQAARLWVKTNLDVSSFEYGESITVDGVCLTVAEARNDEFCADISSESLTRSTLMDAGPGRKVNLERAMQASDRFGGHFVLGHVDGVGRIRENRPEGDYRMLVIAPPADLMRYMVEKGSVAINGVSLTINAVETDYFSMMLIPTTLAETNLVDAKPSEKVNIETDIIGKYIERFLAARTGGITLEKLKQEGWD